MTSSRHTRRRVAGAVLALWGAACAGVWATGCGGSEQVSTEVKALEEGSARAGRLRPGDYSGYNVIVISVDTLRADHLGLYGYQRDTSPALDRISEESIVFDRSQAPRGLTWPSLISMLTSLYPVTSNVRRNGDLLADDVPTLSSVLAREGYASAAFLSNACAALPGRFDTLRCEPSDESVTREAIRWLREEAASSRSPFFLWAHYWGPHEEYEPKARFNVFVDAEYSGPATGSRKFLDRAIIEQRALAPADLDHVVALYDGEVLATDSQIDALWQGLLEEGLLDRSIVILTADHGEELGQHARYFYHACSTYDAVLHIPLLIRLPGARLAGMRVPQVVENLDIMPTVLELLGVDLLDSYEGQSMLPLLNSEPSAADSFSSSFAEYYRARIGWVRSIRTERWRYIYNPEEIVPRCRPNHGYFELAAEELYDHRVDPKELNNVIASHPEVAAELKRELLGALADRDPPPPALRADPEVLEQLKELGYLGD